MTRRPLLSWLTASVAVGPAYVVSTAPAAAPERQGPAPGRIERLELSAAQWAQRLTPEQYRVLREEGTERAGTSALNHEKRSGTYHCAGCDLPLFGSAMKFDSGTGWPSFFSSLPGAFETRPDRKLFLLRTEYHCARCGGHHGHVFDDGPPPTGQRWCNNGVALRFAPAQS